MAFFVGPCHFNLICSYCRLQTYRSRPPSLDLSLYIYIYMYVSLMTLRGEHSHAQSMHELGSSKNSVDACGSCFGVSVGGHACFHAEICAE